MNSANHPSANIDDKIRVQKRLGLYYTPREVAEPLAFWCIRNAHTKVLDPAYGNCVLLKAAKNSLRLRGCRKPGRLLYGVDLDEDAQGHVKSLLKTGARERNFLTTDFLSVPIKRLPGQPYQAVMANPPFVRRHLIPRNRLKVAKNSVLDADVQVSGKSSYWAYFLVRSIQALEKNGRLAFLLPLSFLQADYSKHIVTFLEKSFRNAKAVVMNGRVFSDTQETIVALLAEGYLAGESKLTTTLADSIDELVVECKEDRGATPKSTSPQGTWPSFQLSSQTLKLLRNLKKDPNVRFLKELATIRIGVVTGANKFFVLERSRVENLSLSPSNAKPILNKACLLKGLKFSKRDFKELSAQERRCYLLKLSNDNNATRELREYLKTGENGNFHKRTKCKSRTPWYHVENIWKPDAFYQYMSASVPRLILNRTSATCTNTIHRIKWHKGLTASQKTAVALGSMSSLSLLSSEIVGRSYGGGVLKLEPKDLGNLLVPFPPPSRKVTESFRSADRTLRVGNRENAIDIADSAILRDFLGLKDVQIRSLKKGALKLQNQRLHRATHDLV